MCDVPSIAVFCSESIECFPGTVIIIIIIIIIDFLTSQLRLGNVHLSWDVVINSVVVIIIIFMQNRDRIPVGTRYSTRPDRPSAHPASCTMDT